jgi:hypothetical protein
MSIIHTLYPNKVRLDKDAHKYFDLLGNEYMSFSKLFHFVSTPFDAQNISRHVARAQNTSQEDVLSKWTKQRDNGTKIDEALELYAYSGQILESNANISDLIKSIITEYKVFNKCYEQLVVYSEKYRVAGSLDKMFLFSNRKDSAFGMSDFKAFEKGDLHVHRGWMNEPFSHLPNTKYTKISFQLSYYAHLFEELTSRKCKQLFIHLIDPVNKTHQKIPLNYMKTDVKLLLETYKNQVLSQLEVEEGF